MPESAPCDKGPSLLDRIIRFSFKKRLFVLILLLTVILGGVMVAPFDWQIDILPRAPVSVDAISDEMGLIDEMLGTLNTVLIDQILMTIIVVLVMLKNLRASMLISGLLPVTVLAVFVAMKVFGIDANIVALSGTVIAVGVIVNVGIVITENILRHLSEAEPGEPRLEVVYKAVSEVGSAILTATATTVILFLPVLTMTAAGGKLFKPLAWTMVFALIASVVIALIMIPPAAYAILKEKKERKGRSGLVMGLALVAASFIIFSIGLKFVASAHLFMGLWLLLGRFLPAGIRNMVSRRWTNIAVVATAILLTSHWRPLGYEKHYMLNLLFVGVVIGGLLLLFRLFCRAYEPALRWCLSHRKVFLSVAAAIVLLGGFAWKGFDSSTGFMPSLDAVMIPVALLAIFLILYLQFRRVSTTLLVLPGIFVAWAGGFIMLWLYGRGWFLDFSLFGIHMQELFNIRPYNLSVAVWVGFLALFGIASNDSVLMSTYLEQTFAKRKPGSRKEVHDVVVLAATRRVRPALMISATTILALIPVLTSTGKGADIMVPMAIPSFGGMTVVMISVFLVPVLYSIIAERRTR